MKLKTLRFGTPRDISAPGVDGKEWRFPFILVDSELLGTAREKPQTTTHRVDVVISRHMTIGWSVSDDELPRLLSEIAKDAIRDLVAKGAVPAEHRIKVLTNTFPKVCPYDVSRIPEPDGHAFQLEVANPIGFRP